MKNIFLKLKNFQTFIAVILGSLIIASALIYNKNNDAQAFIDPDSYFTGKEFLDYEIMFGGEKRDVVILEYADLDCPFCKKFQDENFDKLREKYDNKLTFVYRHLPIQDLHPNTALKSLYALCTVDQNKDLYKNVLINSYTKYNGKNTDDYLNFLANEGFDIEKIKKCIEDNTYLEKLQSDAQEAINLGLNSTPNFFILIKKEDKYQILTVIAGARNYDYFSAVIDQAIRLAK